MGLEINSPHCHITNEVIKCLRKVVKLILMLKYLQCYVSIPEFKLDKFSKEQRGILHVILLKICKTPTLISCEELTLDNVC